MNELGRTRSNPWNPKNMKISNIISSILAAGLLAGFLAACACDREHGKEATAKLEAQARITKADAQRTALARVPGGTVKEGEIEKEDGKLVWSFDITTPGTADLTEVLVDALTGAVISVEKETPADQSKEKKADAK